MKLYISLHRDAVFQTVDRVLRNSNSIFYLLDHCYSYYIKSRIVAPGPITSWQIEEEKVETVTDFIFLGSKITVDGDCSHEIKRHLLLMTNLDSI